MNETNTRKVVRVNLNEKFKFKNRTVTIVPKSKNKGDLDVQRSSEIQENELNNDFNSIEENEIIVGNHTCLVSVYSDDYKKMNNNEKLELVRKKIIFLFENSSKKTVGVLYKGQKKQINKDKIGEFKDLVEREKALEKNVVNTPIQSSSISEETPEEITIEQKIRILREKLNSSNDDSTKFDQESIDKMKRVLNYLESVKNSTSIAVVGNNSTYTNSDEISTLIEEIDNNADNTNFEEIGIDTEEYKKLSDEEKLAIIRKQIDNLFEIPGRKNIVVIYKGEKKQINRDKEGLYKDLVEREKALEKTINREENIIEHDNNKKTSFNVLKLPIFVATAAFISKNIKKIKNGISSFSSNVKSKIKCNKFPSSKENKRKNTILKAGLISNISQKFVTSFKNTKMKIIDTYHSSINKFKKKTNTSNLSNSNKKLIKRRVAAALCAVAIAIAGIVTLKAFKNSNINNSNNKEGSSQGDTLLNNPTIDGSGNQDGMENDILNDENNKDDNINVDNNTNNEDNDIIVEEENKDNNEFKLSFDDTVTIDKNSYIYTNSYDATYNTNSLNPYYGGYHERDVQGIVYELDGKIYIVYEYDDNAIEKQKKLENSGAVMTAVLVTRNDLTYTGEYEGYYNVSNVKVKTR